ncbi:hypothetical protein CYY_004605 [Polysphondylium violaceum]|uniref:GATA-type domain-containing protein n=1 Tax=Polysphondylium violaceum TaxID=133409 RepID=A0A8J4PV46_9MYCE|nr:hypothetical protein CYY_004605 [Polysphondylium violaceum]
MNHQFVPSSSPSFCMSNFGIYSSSPAQSSMYNTPHSPRSPSSSFLLSPNIGYFESSPQEHHFSSPPSSMSTFSNGNRNNNCIEFKNNININNNNNLCSPPNSTNTTPRISKLDLSNLSSFNSNNSNNNNNNNNHHFTHEVHASSNSHLVSPRTLTSISDSLSSLRCMVDNQNPNVSNCLNNNNSNTTITSTTKPITNSNANGNPIPIPLLELKTNSPRSCSSNTNSPRSLYFVPESVSDVSPLQTPLSSPRTHSPRAMIMKNSSNGNANNNSGLTHSHDGRMEEHWKKMEYYVNDLSHFVYETLKSKDFSNILELKEKVDEVVNNAKEIEIMNNISKSLPPQTRARKKRSTKAEKLHKDLSIAGGVKRAYVTTPKSKGTYCNFCGTMETPEWRKGPGGHKTLCNACGLHYAKNIKKEESLKEQQSQYQEKEKLSPQTATMMSLANLVNFQQKNGDDEL